jgi:transposase
MKEITTLAIDLAKRVFQLEGVDARGASVLQRQVRRAQLLTVLAQIPPCQVAMEGCATAHYWARKARELGHTPRVIPSQYVKSFSRTQKNDRNDAQAIAMAARQPNVPQVAVKSEEQQAVLVLHRIRERVLKERIQLTNQLDGLLLEFGHAMPRGYLALRRTLASLLTEGKLPILVHQALSDQYEHLAQIELQLQKLTTRIEELAKLSEPCQRLMRHRGVGPIIATAFVAQIADPKTFNNGRQVSAWLGLVPRQHSSGGRERLLGITKRGDTYLRKLLIHGARAALWQAAKHDDALGRWSIAVKERRGMNRAAVALANKNVRRMWAALRYDLDTAA